MPKNFTNIEHLFLSEKKRRAEDVFPCSTKHELKIWFAKPNSDDPLGGIENEIRLLNARARYENHHIRLIYEPKNLSSIAQTKLNRFCKKHKIELFSLDNIEDELQRCLKDGSLDKTSATIQLALLERARQEAQSEWGNLAAASDIVRTLTPALRVSSQDEAGILQASAMRIYTDFDESLAPGLPDTLLLKKGELLKTKNNNNFLFPEDSESDTLKAVREFIFNQYQEKNIISVVSNILEVSYVESMKIHQPPGMWVLLPIYMKDEEGAPQVTEVLEKKLNELRSAYLSSGGGFLPSVISREPYQITDIYSFRHAINEFRFLSELDDFKKYKPFFDICYFQLVIQASGPGVYSEERFVIDNDNILLLQTKINPEESDLSWTDSPHYYTKITAKEIAGEKISKTLGHAFREKKQTLESFKRADAKAPSQDSNASPKKPGNK